MPHLAWQEEESNSKSLLSDIGHSNAHRQLGRAREDIATFMRAQAEAEAASSEAQRLAG